ncbi:hypothetical protein DPMN_152330 [Dreissena polymorpha]|uniref:Uncharacterized protein n=1 Tax=Dreissena polymorpha TaxID=45954 RepID=A0A9D4J885_DREPO|nr:hypothetical protein DPMN_152330 [Dreissena polymorpha]
MNSLSLDCLSIKVYDRGHDCDWQTLHGLNIKSLSVCFEKKFTNSESLSHALSSLTQLELLSIKVKYDGFSTELVQDTPVMPGLSVWLTLHGLSIKSLSLSLKGKYYGWFELKYATYIKQSLLSLTQLETLSISVDEYSPGLLEALHGIKIKRLSLNHEYIECKRDPKEQFPQSLSSLIQLETFTLHLYKYIVLQLPQSLKYFNIYCASLRPSELRDLCDTLTAYSHTIEMSLEFGCASSCLQEYITIHQELTERKNVKVKRFRINESPDFSESTIYKREIGGVDDADADDFSIKDCAYQTFAKCLIDSRIDRISIRLQIGPD